ncbi:MAG: hypothetical protein RMK45_11015 [Armatimonadota bacterium]|nr:hypothetical protein [Armatimonadota bacterium]
MVCSVGVPADETHGQDARATLCGLDSRVQAGVASASPPTRRTGKMPVPRGGLGVSPKPKVAWAVESEP